MYSEGRNLCNEERNKHITTYNRIWNVEINDDSFLGPYVWFLEGVAILQKYKTLYCGRNILCYKQQL